MVQGQQAIHRNVDCVRKETFVVLLVRYRVSGPRVWLVHS